MIDSIQFKRGTTAALESWGKIPVAGEPIFDIELNKLKIGDGIHTYKELPYVAGGSQEEQLVFSNRYEFPNVGKENTLYVAKDECNIYIWKNTHYELLSVDHSEINGGDASSF